VADCYRFLFLANALHFPNRSWLRSFKLAWGLGGKIARISLFFFSCKHETEHYPLECRVKVDIERLDAFMLAEKVG